MQTELDFTVLQFCTTTIPQIIVIPAAAKWRAGTRGCVHLWMEALGSCFRRNDYRGGVIGARCIFDAPYELSPFSHRLRTCPPRRRGSSGWAWCWISCADALSSGGTGSRPSPGTREQGSRFQRRLFEAPYGFGVGLGQRGKELARVRV